MERKGTKLLVLLLLLIFTGSCTKKFDSLKDFKSYVLSEGSPYHKTIIKNGIQFDVVLVPARIIMQPEAENFNRKKDNINQNTNLPVNEKTKLMDSLQAEFNNKTKGYRESVYVQVTIGYTDDRKDLVYEKLQQGQNIYSQWFQKLAYEFKEYVYLSTPQIPEIKPFVYQMDRTFGMTKYRKFLFVFPREYAGRDILKDAGNHLNFNIKEFGAKTGTIKAEFKVPFDKIVIGH